ncbi:right-handed parallel beta-helix repeat-containing protein [Haloarchaeobius sp. HRN-SO-5]|uniref:right-handed parallel beta-helix repeat-containing protein n=1 Tax=Haloarchaeobius sp. HRN-SO-5 TaxID=3446118 RepID=UPI003EB78D2C
MTGTPKDGSGSGEEAVGTGTSRRRYLQGLAALGSAPVLGSVAYESSAATQTYEDRFSTVVDMVDAGADPNAGEPIGDLLHEHAGDDTLLQFPAGEYLMTEQFRFTDYENFGIVGTDATIVPGTIEELDGRSVVEGTFSGPTRLFRLGVSYAPGDRLLFEGLTFDFTDDQSGFRAIEAYVERELTVRDVDIDGTHDVGSFGPALFSVVDPDGISTVEGFRAPDGGSYSENTIGSIEDGPTGILVPPSHQGKLWLRDCELGGFPDQGVYASSTDGRVVVKGGVYRNSNSANVRLMSDYSYIQDATIVVDEAHEGHNQRAIRLDAGKHLWVYNTEIRLSDPNGHAIVVYNDVEKARIQECDITVGEGESNYGIIVRPDAGGVDVFDTTIQFEGSGNPLLVRGRNDDGDAPVHVLRTQISGSGPGTDGRNAIRCLRANALFEDVEVHVDGDYYRRGIEIHGDDCTVDGGVFESTHHPIVNVADGTVLDDLTARSYDGYAGLKLYDGYSDVTVTDSTIYEGYLDQGTDDLVVDGVEFPDS